MTVVLGILFELKKQKNIFMGGNIVCLVQSDFDFNQNPFSLYGGGRVVPLATVSGYDLKKILRTVFAEGLGPIPLFFRKKTPTTYPPVPLMLSGEMSKNNEFKSSPYFVYNEKLRKKVIKMYIPQVKVMVTWYLSL